MAILSPQYGQSILLDRRSTHHLPALKRPGDRALFGRDGEPSASAIEAGKTEPSGKTASDGCDNTRTGNSTIMLPKTTKLYYDRTADTVTVTVDEIEHIVI